MSVHLARPQHRRPGQLRRRVRNGIVWAVAVPLLAVLVVVAVGGGGYALLDWWDSTGASNTPGSACTTCPP